MAAPPPRDFFPQSARLLVGGLRRRLSSTAPSCSSWERMPVARTASAAASALRAFARAARPQPGECTRLRSDSSSLTSSLAWNRGTCSTGRMLQRTSSFDFSCPCYLGSRAIARLAHLVSLSFLLLLGCRCTEPVTSVREPVSSRSRHASLCPFRRRPARLPRIPPRRRRHPKPASRRRADGRKDLDPQERRRQDGALFTKVEAE